MPRRLYLSLAGGLLLSGALALQAHEPRPAAAETRAALAVTQDAAAPTPVVPARAQRVGRLVSADGPVGAGPITPIETRAARAVSGDAPDSGPGALIVPTVNNLQRLPSRRNRRRSPRRATGPRPGRAMPCREAMGRGDCRSSRRRPADADLRRTAGVSPLVRHAHGACSTSGLTPAVRRFQKGQGHATTLSPARSGSRAARPGWRLRNGSRLSSTASPRLKLVARVEAVPGMQWPPLFILDGKATWASP